MKRKKENVVFTFRWSLAWLGLEKKHDDDEKKKLNKQEKFSLRK
jgi:hypothetical protein